MINTNEFSDYYRSISNAELLHIIDNPTAYQATALEAAKIEWEQRKLSSEEIIELKDSINELAAKKLEQIEKFQKVEAIAKSKLLSVLETINPVETGIPSTEKKIRFLTIVYTGMFLIGLISSIKLIILYIKHSYIEGIFANAEFVILPLAIFLFWKRRTVGWILFSIYVTFSITMLIMTCIRWSNAITPSILLQLIFFSSTQIVLCNKDVKEAYNISSLNMAATIVLTFLATCVLVQFI